MGRVSTQTMVRRSSPTAGPFYWGARVLYRLDAGTRSAPRDAIILVPHQWRRRGLLRTDAGVGPRQPQSTDGNQFLLLEFAKAACRPTQSAAVRKLRMARHIDRPHCPIWGLLKENDP